MSDDDDYALIDFGDGRKLESLAGRLVDRPSPAAEGSRRSRPALWRDAESRFDTAARRWHHRTPWPAEWVLDCGAFRMPCRPTPYGHVGVFPEQRPNWEWLAASPAAAETQDIAPESRVDPPRGLNLFAYTGASTIAMAKAGYQVVHVDAAKPNVATAKSAAALNDLQDHRIRYLVDDAAKFAAREVRRGNLYQVVVLDPPAYGHSPGGKAWRIERDLWPLLEDCLRLADPAGHRLLVTGHSPQVDGQDVARFLAAHDYGPGTIRLGRSQLKTRDGPDDHGRKLDAGFYVRATKSSALPGEGGAI